MPAWRSAIEERISGLRLHPVRAAEVVEELSQHLDDRYAELRAAGASEDTAIREALAELASPGLGRRSAKREGDFLAARLAASERQVDPEPAIIGRQAAWHDVRYAVRMLRVHPGFAAVAILTLALAIGATTAIFSVVDAVMLRPLPFADPDRLVRIWESDVKRGRPEFAMSQPNFLDFRAQNRSFESFAATTSVSMTVGTSDGGVERVIARAVSIDFLPAVGAAPALGRNFTPDEDRPGGNRRVAIITHGFWQRHFGGDPTVLDKTLTLNDAVVSVVGVLPKSFPWPVPDLDVLTPLAANPAQPRADHRLLTIGRLKPGVTLQQATTDLATIAARLSAQYPDSNGGWSVLLRSFYDWLVPQSARRMLLVFFAAVGFVLLIAASNVANLMLARAAARQKEMSIRVALGASRMRIVTQLLVESMVLAVVAGALGCGIALGATQALKAMGTEAIPRLDEVVIDAGVLLFAFAVSMGTGILFGLAPALQASRPDMSDALKEGGRTGGSGVRQRLRHALVVAEVALSVALLVGAGLLIRSMWALQRVDPGFNPHTLLTMQVSVSGAAYQADGARWAFYRRALEKITALPGVASAATSSIVPMGGGNTSIEVVIEGRPADAAGILPSADWRVVSRGYFNTLGMTLHGRDFDERDVETNPAAIISAEMARRYWPGADPIGRQFRWHNATGTVITVIGVASDVRHLALETDPAPIIYLPHTAFDWNPMFFTVRTATDPAAHVAAVRAAVRSVDPKQPISNVRTGTEILATSVEGRRFNMFLLVAFAGVALVLASVGLFGVMSYLVSQRTHDIGVRLALGASRGDVLRLVVGRGMLLASSGAVAGVLAAFWLSRSLDSLLFGVRSRDAATFASVVVVLLGVALAACYVPALRATRVDPVVALRHD